MSFDGGWGDLFERSARMRGGKGSEQVGGLIGSRLGMT